MKFFLERVLKGEKYKKQPLTPEGSGRQYFRVKTENNSYVLACFPVGQQERVLQRWKDFSKWGLNVPKVYFCEPSQPEGFLLLEDLGDHNLEREVLENKDFPFSYYYLSLDQIITLSSQKDSLEGEKENSRLEPQNDYKGLSFFTKESFFKEMLWTEKYLVNDFCQFQPDKKLQIKYLREWRHICETLSSFSYRLAHRDYHSRNIFIKDKKTYVIDFQDAGFFPRFYDVVSLLYDVYVHSKMTEEIRGRLLQYFISNHTRMRLTSGVLEEVQERPEAPPQKDMINFFTDPGMAEKIRQEIAITAIQRLFKACGSFAGFYSLKKQDTHLRYIVPALEILKEKLQEIDQYPYFLSLIDLLLEADRKWQS